MTLSFPAPFLQFLQDNHIDPAIYAKTPSLPRYVRIIRPADASPDQLIAELSADAHCSVHAIPGLPGFLSISDSSVKLKQLRAYARGAITGMDVSSGIAALALEVGPGDNVLDLCCAPGAKLLLLAEHLQGKGSVTGVDIAEHRMAICRSLVKKHAGDDKIRIRLFVSDGTSFDEYAPRLGWDDPQIVKEAGRQSGRARPWFASKMLAAGFAGSGTELYDRVLVDAECTHDGSLVHVAKYQHWGFERLADQVTNDADHVPLLQSQLLENAWRLLRPGGSLVYSTCSLSRRQNEAVVGGFLSRHSDAVLLPIPALSSIAVSPIWTPHAFDDDRIRRLFDRMRHAVRLDPLVSNTSGMFIARIQKPPTASNECLEQEIVPLDI
ncbi:hypothetical protein EC988_003112 [Linderina pennispora]|nr:hypothetical protein EC988_003112 [Linderina pennispora]